MDPGTEKQLHKQIIPNFAADTGSSFALFEAQQGLISCLPFIFIFYHFLAELLAQLHGILHRGRGASQMHSASCRLRACVLLNEES